MARPWPMRRGRRTVPRSQSGTPKRRSNTPKIGILGAHPQVAPQGQLDAAGYGEPLHGGDHRFGEREAGRAHRPGALVEDGSAIAFGERLEVRSGTERAFGTGQDGDGPALVLLELEKGGEELCGAEAVDGIAPLGPRDLHNGDRAVVDRPKPHRSGRGRRPGSPAHSRMMNAGYRVMRGRHMTRASAPVNPVLQKVTKPVDNW